MMEKVQKVESVNIQSDCKQRVKNEQIKRKQTCSVSFVEVFKFQENKFKIAQKKFQEIMTRYSGKPTGHDDHYMINMGGQRSKTGGN